MNERDFNDLQGQVETLRRRLDDQGTMLRRTHAAVTTLAESLGNMVSGQRQRERRLNLNSFVAYTLFTLLLGGGFFAMYSVRANDLVSARDNAVQERDVARERVTRLEDRISARERAERNAYEYYGLIRDNKRSEAIARYAEIEEEQLTPTEKQLFAESVADARGHIVDAGYLAGLDAYRLGELDTATTELQRALAYEDQGPRAAQMRYYLGMSLYKQDDFENAARQLELAIASRVDQSGVGDARYYLAASLEALGKYAEARIEYDKFASANPNSTLTITARRKSAQLARKASPVN